MNDLQIDYFMAVATNLSFTKTSEELYVSQPAISRQISLLEKELGVQLFYRNNKRTSLTEAGELYYEFFRDMKMNLRNTQYRVAQLQKSDTSVVRVGFLEGWDLSPFFPKFIAAAEERYPNTEVVIDCCGIKELSTLLLTGNIDIALTMSNAFSDIPEVECNDVYRLRKIILFSAKSRFADAEDLHPADFRDETFIAPWGVADKMISRIIESYCEPYGFMPKIRFVHNNETMVTFVRNDMGVAFSDMWAWAKGSPDLRYIPITNTDPICVASMKDSENSQANGMAMILADVIHDSMGTGEL